MKFILRLLLLLLLEAFPALAATSTLTGTFVDASGNPVNGYLILQLPVPAVDTATGNSIAVTPVRYRVVNGIVQSGPPVYDVAGLQPQNLYYITSLYDNSGTRIFTANYFITGTPFNLSAAIPTNITTSNISFAVGNLVSLAGNNAFTGAFTTKNFWAEVYAAAFPGADCGLKIAAAATALPTNGGVINVNQACGTGTATSPWTAVTLSGLVTLRFVEPGVYWIGGITQTSAAGNFGSAITGLTCSKTNGGPTPQQCPVELHMGNSLNSPFVIKLGMANAYLRDILIDGNASNNATGGVCVLASGGSLDINGDTIQNCPTHGVEFAGVGTTHNADGTRIRTTWILNNKADGVFALNAGDLQWGEGSTSLLNGTTATVNTTNTTITATSGSWSTDSSLIGTMVRVNNSGMCQIVAVPSTTTMTVATTTCWNASGVPTGLGTQTGVPMVFGNSWEGNNSPTTRFSHGELSTSKMDAALFYGTTTGFGSNKQIITGAIQFGNDGNHDIEIIGSCLDTQTSVCAIGHTISGNNFIGSQQRTASAGTYDFIKLVDLTQSNITGNTFTVSGGANQEKSLVEQVESAGSRVNGPTTVSANIFLTNPLAVAPYIDNTVIGTFGQQFAVHGGLNSSLDIFNAAPGATSPHKYLLTATDGSLRVVNNAFSTTLFQLNDSGVLFLGALGATLNLAGATSGFGTLQAPATGGVTNTLPSVTGTLPVVIGSGTATMTTAAITAGNCGTTVTVSASGVLTTDTITWAFNAAPAGSNAGIVAWPTANNVNFAYCSNTAQTPAAATINWRVVR